MTAIIFGAGGQDGRYLTSYLRSLDLEVLAVSRSVGFLNIELTSLKDISTLIRGKKPKYIFHLAANSSTKYDVWKDNHDAICAGTLNILDAVKTYSPHTRVFLAGSGLQFKNLGNPIKETDEFEASSMYSLSRIQAVEAARHFRGYGLSVYVGYLFNHDSPLRSERHINRLIVEAVKRIVSGSDEKLRIGDLNVKKEFGFSGDIVKAFFKLINQEDAFEAVIGTGRAYSIREWVDYCFSKYGLNWQHSIVIDDSFKPAYQILVSDPSTINSLGWEHETTFEQLADMMLLS